MQAVAGAEFFGGVGGVIFLGVGVGVEPSDIFTASGSATVQ